MAEQQLSQEEFQLEPQQEQGFPEIPGLPKVGPEPKKKAAAVPAEKESKGLPAPPSREMQMFGGTTEMVTKQTKTALEAEPENFSWLSESFNSFKSFDTKYQDFTPENRMKIEPYRNAFQVKNTQIKRHDKLINAVVADVTEDADIEGYVQKDISGNEFLNKEKLRRLVVNKVSERGGNNTVADYVYSKAARAAEDKFGLNKQKAVFDTKLKTANIPKPKDDKIVEQEFKDIQLNARGEMKNAQESVRMDFVSESNKVNDKYAYSINQALAAAPYSMNRAMEDSRTQLLNENVDPTGQYQYFDNMMPTVSEEEVKQRAVEMFEQNNADYLNTNYLPILGEMQAEVNSVSKKYNTILNRKRQEIQASYEGKFSQMKAMYDKDAKVYNSAIEKLWNDSGTEVQSDYEKRMKETYDNMGLGEAFGRKFTAAAGNMLYGIGAHLRSNGVTGSAVDFLSGVGQYAKYYNSTYAPSLKDAYLSPKYWAGGVGELLGSSSIIAAATIATKNPYIGAVISNLAEGSSMAGTAYEDQLMKGKDPIEASNAASNVAKMNMLTMPLNALQAKLFMPFTKGKGFTGAFKKLASGSAGSSVEEMFQSTFEEGEGFKAEKFYAPDTLEMGLSVFGSSMLMGVPGGAVSGLVDNMGRNRKIPSPIAQVGARMARENGPSRIDAVSEALNATGEIDDEQALLMKAASAAIIQSEQDATRIGIEGDKKDAYVGISYDIKQLEATKQQTQSSEGKAVIDRQIADKKQQLNNILDDKVELASVTIAGAKIVAPVEEVLKIMDSEQFAESLSNQEVSVDSKNADVVAKLETIRQQQAPVRQQNIISDTGEVIGQVPTEAAPATTQEIAPATMAEAPITEIKTQEDATKISTGPQQEVGQPSNLVQPTGVEQGQQEIRQGEGAVGQATQQAADARNRNFGSQEEQIAATAKALTRGYSKDEMVLRNKAEDLIPIDIKQKQISPSEKLSEAYVKAKADGSNPELVKAVEDLIGQPAAPMAEAAPVAEPEIAAAEKAFLDAFKGEQIEAVPVVEAATAMEAPTVTGPVEQQVISEAAPKRGRRRKIEAPAEEQKTTVTEQVKSAVAQEPTPLSEDAKGHATSLGGVAFEVRPGLGIVQGFNMFGKPIYAGFKGGSRTKVDIDSYTGTGFTSEELAELKALRQNIEATEAANQAQFGSPFDRQGRVAASDSVPDNVKGFVNELTANLGIGNNIFIITDSDFTKEQFDKHGLYGTLAQVRSALLSSRNPLEYGAKRFMSDANAYYIYYDSKLTDAQRFTTISHEIGHIVEQSQFNNASTETKNKINEDYQKWFANLSGKSLADVINETRDITIQELFEGNTGNFNPSQHRYISSFTEYFADNVAKWARTSEKPRGLVDTFFANLKDLFTKILDYVTRTGNYSKNIFEWLDGLYGTNVSGVNPDNEMLSAMAARPGKQGSAAQIKNLANLYMDRELKKGRSVDEAGVIARSNLTSFLLANVKDYATALQKAGIALDNVIEEAKQEAQAKQRQEALNKMFATPKVRSLVDAAQKTADDIVKANKGKKIGKTSPTQAYKNILSDLIKKINTMYARGNYPAGIPSVTLVKAASGIAQDAVNAAFPRAEKLSIQEAEMASMTTREYIRTMVANQINAIGKVKDRAKFIQKAVGEIIDTLKDSFGADFTLSSSALKQLNKSLFDAVFSRMDDTAAIDDIIAKVSPVVEYAMRKQMLSSTAKLLDKIRSNYDNGRYSGATRLSVRESLYDADARKWLNSNASLEDISLFNQYLKELTGRSVNTTNLNNAIQLADAFVPSPKVATTNKKDALNNKIKNLTRKIGTGAVYLADYKALVRLEKAISDIEQKKGDLTGLTQEEQDEIMNNYNDLLDTLPNPIEQLVEDAKAQIEAEAKSKVAALNEAIATSQEFRDSIKNPLLYEGVLRFAKELTDDFINSLPTKDKALLAENIDEIMNGNPNSITYEFSSKAGAFKQANINYKFGKDIFGKRQLIGENGLTGAFNKVRRAFMDVDYNRASAERMAASFDLFRFHLMDAELNTGVDEFGMGVLESSVFGPLAKAIDSAFNKVTEALGPLQESMKLLNDKSNRAAIKKGIGELNRELGTGFFGGKAAWMHMKKLLGYGNSFYMDISTRMATIVATQIDHISNLEEGESPVDVVLLRNILDVTPEQYDGRTMKEQYEGNPTSITGMTDDAQMFDHIAYGILTKGGVNKLSDLNKDELLALLTDSQRQAIAKWREHIDNNKYVVEAAMIMKGNVTAFLNEYFPRKVYSKEGVSEIKDIEEYLKSAGGNVGVDSGQLKSRKGEKGRLDLNGNAVLYNNLKDIYLIHEVKPTLDALKGLDDAVAKLKNEKDLGAATYAEAISIAMASRVKNALESNEKIANQDYSFWYKSVSKVTSAASRVILISQLRQAFADFPSNIAKLSASLGFANRTLKNQVLQVVSPTKSSYTTDKGEFVWDDYVKIALTTGSSVHRVMSVYADNFLYEFSKSKEQLQREQRVGSWQDMAVKKHAWMSRFEQAFERITGEALDHKAFEDERGAYRAMYYDSVQKASDVADSFIDRQYGLSSFARQPLRINVFAPFVGRFLRNVFGKSPTIAKNNPASVILGFLSGYPGVQHQLFSRYIRSALSTDRSMSKKQRAEDITRALTEVIAPSVMYNTIRATTGILFTTTAAAVMAAGDSEEDRKRLYKQMEEMPFWKRWFTKIRLAAGDGEEKLYNAVVNGMLSSAVDPNVNALIRPAIGFTIFKTWKENAIEEMTKKGNTKKEIAEAKQKIRDIESVWFETYGIRPIELFGTKEYAEGIKRYYPAGAATEGVEDLIKSTGGFGILYNEVSRLMDVNKLINATDENKNLSETEVYAAAGLKLAGLTFSNIILRGNAGAALSMFSGDMNKLSNMIISDQKSIQTGFEIKQKKKQSGKQKGSSRLRKRETRKRNRGR